LTSDGRPKVPFKAYSGSEPFVFVSYAHRDAETVYKELKWLRDAGFNIWYDEGISPGRSWPEELANAINKCSLFLLFVTPSSAESENCEREVTFSFDEHKPFLAIHLEDTNLGPGLKLSIGNSQAILRFRQSQRDYREKVTSTLTEFLGEVPSVEVVETTHSRSFAKRTLLIGLAVFVVVGSYFGYGAYRTAALDDWATNTALPAILAHASDERFDEAFDLALELQSKVGSSDLLEPHWSQFSTTVQAKTEPPGVDVYGRPYVSSDSDWRFVGTTPLEERVPFGPKRWRFEKAGFETILNGTPEATIQILEMPALQMTASDEVVPGMVPVPSSVMSVAYAGLGGATQVGRFQIARFEVTNREYFEFVEAGGYDDANLWRDLDFVEDGRSLSFADAQARFRDQTDRVGPATWEFGRFPEGKDDHPVAGVSWYEAVAYARYRGGVLPTLYHWNLAAYDKFAHATPLVAVMSSVANIGGRPIQKVGASDSMGAFGTYDMVGNVREWIWNKGATGRWILGGSASQPDYMAVSREEVQPFDRSPEIGLRIMIPTDDISGDLLAPAALVTRDFRNEKPVSDEAYRVLRQQFEYDPAATATVVHEEPVESYRLQKVHLQPQRGESFDIYIALPTSTEPPWPAVVYFPGFEFFISAEPDCMTRARDSLVQNSSSINPSKIPLEMGRALVVPVWAGACERFDALPRTRQMRRAAISAWREDLGRTLDYLDSREDVKTGEYGFFGWSYGGSSAVPLLALEDRLKTAILLSGGFPGSELPEIADPINYLGRSTLPVLMLAGRFDGIRPIQTNQRIFFDMLGTPAEDKKLVTFEAGHGPLPRVPLLRAVADWLDLYLPL